MLSSELRERKGQENGKQEETTQRPKRCMATPRTTTLSCQHKSEKHTLKLLMTLNFLCVFRRGWVGRFGSVVLKVNSHSPSFPIMKHTNSICIYMSNACHYNQTIFIKYIFLVRQKVSWLFYRFWLIHFRFAENFSPEFLAVVVDAIENWDKVIDSFSIQSIERLWNVETMTSQFYYRFMCFIIFRLLLYFECFIYYNCLFPICRFHQMPFYRFGNKNLIFRDESIWCRLAILLLLFGHFDPCLQFCIMFFVIKLSNWMLDSWFATEFS